MYCLMIKNCPVSKCAFSPGGKGEWEGGRAYADDSASAEIQHAFQNTVEPGMLSTRTERH